MRHIITLIATTGIALTTLGTADIAKATTGAPIVETAVAAPIADEPMITESLTINDGTIDEIALVEELTLAFANAGLTLPPLTVTFSDDSADCKGHAALHHQFVGNITVCTTNRVTIAHEMGHAWAAVNLSDADRDAYTALWGLPTWGSHDFSWDERATEKAANTIAWAIALDNPEPSEHMADYLCTYEALTGNELPRTVEMVCTPDLSAAA